MLFILDITMAIIKEQANADLEKVNIKEDIKISGYIRNKYNVGIKLDKPCDAEDFAIFLANFYENSIRRFENKTNVGVKVKNVSVDYHPNQRDYHVIRENDLLIFRDLEVDDFWLPTEVEGKKQDTFYIWQSYEFDGEPCKRLQTLVKGLEDVLQTSVKDLDFF